MARIALLFFLCLLPACTRQPGGTLTLRSLASEQAFSQPFSHAYFSQSGLGDYHIVLINDQFDQPERKDRSQAIPPSSTPPTRQVIHIHVLWNPLSGTRADNPSATNAAIDWYVIGLGSDQAKDLLHYQGAGFVMVRGSGDSRSISLRNTMLKPSVVAGNMSDRLGATSLEGNFTATKNHPRVETLLADIESSAGAIQARR